jgi:hypothetical protein
LREDLITAMLAEGCFPSSRARTHTHTHAHPFRFFVVSNFRTVTNCGWCRKDGETFVVCYRLRFYCYWSHICRFIVCAAHFHVVKVRKLGAHLANYDHTPPNVVGKGKKVKVTRSVPILAYWGRGGIAPLLLTHDIRRGWVVSITPRLHLPLGKIPGTHCTGGWVGTSAGWK